MTCEESLKSYGLAPNEDSLDSIRHLLQEEIELECNGEQREEDLALLCCVQLFASGLVEDSLLIWEAKNSGFDLGSYLDVHLLCGRGLERTKQFLTDHNSEESLAAFSYIEDCEKAGDFLNWSPESQIKYYRNYFGV